MNEKVRLQVRGSDGDWHDVGLPTGYQPIPVVSTSPESPVSSLDPSFHYDRDGDGNITVITMTIGAVSYQKTFTWTAGKLTDESVWVEV